KQPLKKVQVKVPVKKLPPEKPPVKVPVKRTTPKKPRQVPKESSPPRVIEGPWHYDPFAYLEPEERETRGGYKRVLDAFRRMEDFPTAAEMQPAHAEVREFRRLHPGAKIVGLSAPSAALFLASATVADRHRDYQSFPDSVMVDAACDQKSCNFLAVRRHIIAHSVFHLHCMALDPAHGGPCKSIVLGGRTFALLRHLRDRHGWQQWQLDELKLVDGFACWPQYACAIVHAPGEFSYGCRAGNRIDGVIATPPGRSTHRTRVPKSAAGG
ncbi:hypothetical protein AURDEDRAFT_172749, partial [Auricularia subglabra TFB-10046 SS5]